MSRLRKLLDGGLDLPSGRVLVLRPDAEADLSPLPDALIVHGFRPLHDRFAAAGRDVAATVPPDGAFAAALVFASRSRRRTRALVAEAAARAPLVLVDGRKRDGIESCLRDVEARAEVLGVLSAAHGRIFAFRGGEFADWKAGARVAGGMRIPPGAFSEDGPDPGSELLARALPDDLSGRVADLGAGWGYLSARILERPGVAELHAVEADRDALDCARLNLDDPRARFHWADAATVELPGPADAVVTNPPFHLGRAAEPALGQAFVAAAARLLAPRGRLWMVANRRLPYEAAAAERFHRVAEVGGDARYKLLLAERPRRGRRR